MGREDAAELLLPGVPSRLYSFPAFSVSLVYFTILFTMMLAFRPAFVVILLIRATLVCRDFVSSSLLASYGHLSGSWVFFLLCSELVSLISTLGSLDWLRLMPLTACS